MLRNTILLSLCMMLAACGGHGFEGKYESKVESGMLGNMASKDGTVLWEQTSHVQWKTGTQGLKTTSNNELQAKLRAALAPMISTLKD